MRVFESLKKNYKSWFSVLLISLLGLIFELFLSEIIESIHLNIVIIWIYALCLILITSLVIFLFLNGEFEFHEMMHFNEYEPEDLRRFNKSLKKSIKVYSFTLAIWIITIITLFIKCKEVLSFWRLLYLIILPTLILAWMYFTLDKIKYDYKDILSN